MVEQCSDVVVGGMVGGLVKQTSFTVGDAVGELVGHSTSSRL